MPRDIQKISIKLIQYILGLAVLGWLIWRTDWSSIADLTNKISINILLALGVITVGSVVLRAYTWYVLASKLVQTNLTTIIRFDLVVNFLNQLLPSRFSGRSAAPLLMRHYTGMEWSDSLAVIGFHTGIYSVLYGLVALIGLLLGYGQMSEEVTVLIILSVGGYIAVGGIVLFTGLRLDSILKNLSKIPKISQISTEKKYTPRVFKKLPSFSTDSANTFQRLASDIPAVGGYTIGWLGAMVIAPSLRVWLLFITFGVEFEPLILLPLYLVAAYSVTILPLTPGGIGITEATAAVVFTDLGVPQYVIVPVIFADRVLGVYLPALIGWYPSLRIEFSEILSKYRP